MASTTFRVTFTLDETDAAYFRNLFRNAQRTARSKPPEEVLCAARALVESVQAASKTPKFVIEATRALEDLAELIEDKDYRPPKAVVNQVLGALAYFANPQDLIPDEVPVLGFLDDAIMIKFVAREFKHELTAYRKFRRFRDGAEQRPWTKVAAGRLPQRLAAERRRLRAEVDARTKADRSRGILGI